MIEDNKWWGCRGSGVVLSYHCVLLELPVYVCVLLYYGECVTINREISEKLLYMYTIIIRRDTVY